jgi:hypothetical protein
MSLFNRLNNIVGWLVFLVAATTYTLTLEPTASFWDCGEFLSAAYKLQVVHPPGAAFFLTMGRIFTLGADPADVAWRVNFMNGLASAFSILFLFWTITAIARKIMLKGEDDASNMGKIIAVLGAGAVGALCYTFTDSFWFSAVEGEVYALSSMTTALVFWLIFKWDSHADEADSDRWLILLAFLMGISAGIHLLNLLCIPAICFVYYLRRYTFSWFGLLKTFFLGCIILVFIQIGVIAKIPSLAAYFDRTFVNSFGTERGAGSVFFLIILGIGTAAGLWWSQRKANGWWKTGFLMFAFILISYSSTFVVVIRSKANPSIDMNDPEDPYSLVSYINREQYGDVPLLSGPYYNAGEPIEQKEGPKKWRWDAFSKKYVQMDGDPIYKYDSKKSTIFPRIYKRAGTQERHLVYYENFTGIKRDDPRKPSWIKDNLGFMFSYQLGTLWFRYFMWNFTGRQNDIQGHGPGWFNYQREGNWISGIPALDNAINPHVENQNNLPESATNNWGRNTYFFLPLLFGIFGLIYHFKKDRNMAVTVLNLFVLTGIAINLYLNPDPVQPRERDYVYVGSFYAFAIWVGLGVLMLVDFLMKKMDGKMAATLATIIGILAVPTIMASQNWNDHDRSGKYTARDFAIDYLESCAPNAILFTMGDNDTYPLWYAQEVEGIRTDVRIINLSLLGTDWYINQMREPVNGHPGLKMTLQPQQITQGTRDYVPVVPSLEKLANNRFELTDVMNFIASDKNQEFGIQIPFLPSQKLRISVDTVAAIKNGWVTERFRPYMAAAMEWDVPKQYLFKNDLAMFDIIANNLERPIYFTVSMPTEQYCGLQKYFQVEGLTYRLVPVNFQAPQGEIGLVEPDLMFNNMVKKFVFGNMNGKQHGPIYIDPETLRMTINLRQNYVRTADALINIGDKTRALQALDKMEEEMPHPIIPMDGRLVLRQVDALYRAGGLDKAQKKIESYWDWIGKDLTYYGLASMKDQMEIYKDEINLQNYIMNSMLQMMEMNGQKSKANTLRSKMISWMGKLTAAINQQQQ